MNIKKLTEELSKYLPINEISTELANKVTAKRTTNLRDAQNELKKVNVKYNKAKANFENNADSTEVTQDLENKLNNAEKELNQQEKATDLARKKYIRNKLKFNK